MLFEDSYMTIEKPATGLYKDRGSRFLGFAFPVSSEAEVKNHLNELRKEHHQANHHGYAYRIGPDKSHFRFSDDREPSGTAGRPILNQILSAGLSDVLVVVARYFGGSLLGVPGLIQAYKSAAADALAHCKVVEKVMEEKYRIVFSFDLMNEVMGLLKSNHASVISQDAGEHCTIDYRIRKNKADELNNRLRQLCKTGSPPVITVL